MPHRVAWPPCPCPLNRSCNPQCHMPRRHRHNECAAVSISTLRHLCWSNGAVSCAGDRAWELERGVEVGDIAFCSGCSGCPRLSVCLSEVSRSLFLGRRRLASFSWRRCSPCFISCLPVVLLLLLPLPLPLLPLLPLLLLLMIHWAYDDNI